MALLYDTIILVVIGYSLAFLIEDFLVSIGNYGLLVGFVIQATYFTICNSKLTKGQTVGKYIMNIQVVDINGNTIGVGKSFLRTLILSLPYFAFGFTVNVVVSALQTIIQSSMAIGVVVIYIFNKQTRQSLHDLIAGTFVATTARNEEPVPLPRVTKTPFYVFGGLVTLVTIFTVFIAIWRAPNPNVLSTYSKVSEINGVIKAAVIENTTIFNGSKTLSYNANIWVQDLPDNLENDKIVREVVQIILNNATNINSFDVISISVTRGFNIGIAGWSSTKSVWKSPNQWREILQEKDSLVSYIRQNNE